MKLARCQQRGDFRSCDLLTRSVSLGEMGRSGHGAEGLGEQTGAQQAPLSPAQLRSTRSVCLELHQSQLSKPQLAGTQVQDCDPQSPDDTAQQLTVQLPQSRLGHYDISLSQQEHFLPLLQLDSQMAPLCKKQLVKGCQPYPQLLQTWQEHEQDPAVCGARLIGDAQKPDDYVGVVVHDLISSSAWAAARLRRSDMQNSGIGTIVPVCTSAAVVKRLVEALYSGHIELQEDVEQLLVLANCMQVGLLICSNACRHLALAASVFIQHRSLSSMHSDMGIGQFNSSFCWTYSCVLCCKCCIWDRSQRMCHVYQAQETQN